jgi:hypothetical protein
MSRSASIRNYTPLGEYDGDVGLDNDPMYYLQRLFVYFLQNLFRDFPEGCGLKWKPDDENTEILITAEKPRLEAVEKTPHITCVLGSGQWSGLGLDQFQTHRASDGQRTHTDLMPMSMSYHCQAKEGMVARRLAWNASLGTIQLRRILMRVGGLHHVAPQHSISPEGPITQFTGPTVENELVEVVVNVPFYWQPQWRIRRASEVWRRMSITMNVNEASPMYSAGRAAVLRPPMAKGRPVPGTPTQAPPEEAFVQKVNEEEFFEEE